MQRRDDSGRIQLNRRQTLAGLGSAIAASGGLAVVMADDVAATVSIDEFAAEDGTLDSSADVTLNAALAYEYAVDGDVDSMAFELRVDEHTIASDELATSAQEVANSHDMAGALTDSPAFDDSEFAVDEETTFELDVSVWFGVLNSSGDVLAEAMASDSSTLVIEPGASARIGGVVTVTDG